MPIRRLYMLCEGPTEEGFVNSVLRDHLFAASGTMPIPILPSNRAGSNNRRHKGGWTSYAKARATLRRLMEQDRASDAWFTTLLDLYALPSDFPSVRTVGPSVPAQRIAALEAAFLRDAATDDLWRFTPHLQLHEFEALLLVDVDAIARAFPASAPAAAAALKADVGHRKPEEVDDGRDSAPSKRIARHFPDYAGAKATSGPAIAADIGLPRLRAACPHFDAWLTTLEARCRE